MYLSNICVSGIRNLIPIELTFGKRFNVFWGENGSGKTSLLESVHLLSLGRSFRTKTAKQLINFDAQTCTVYGQVNVPGSPDSVISLGVERQKNGGARFRVAEQPERSVSELAKVLPVQVVNNASHLLVEGPPEHRRQFLDWAVFHVEPSFLQCWRNMRQALEQRNAQLKQSGQRSGLDLAVWDASFVEYAEAVNAYRMQFFSTFCQVLQPLVQRCMGFEPEMVFCPGWQDDLAQTLRDGVQLDLMYGVTHKGPQRADIKWLFEGTPLKQVLSRGQIKLFTCLALVARASVLAQRAQKPQHSVFLVDDLTAELDPRGCRIVIEMLEQLGCQVFITGIEKSELEKALGSEQVQWFHVEQGRINAA